MENYSDSAENNVTISAVFGWLFGIIVLAVGVLNLLLVHPVPGIVYLLLSLIYFPPANALLKTWLGITVPPLLKIVLGLVLFFFTLGVSDLGDMLDKLLLNQIRTWYPVPWVAAGVVAGAEQKYCLL